MASISWAVVGLVAGSGAYDVVAGPGAYDVEVSSSTGADCFGKQSRGSGGLFSVKWTRGCHHQTTPNKQRVL
eukprot:9476671-Pyramimonas_sp.AAC.1